MTDKSFMADVSFIRDGGNILNFSSQMVRIEKEKKCIFITASNNGCKMYHLRQFAPKKLKTPDQSTKTCMVPMFLDVHNADNIPNKQLKLIVKPEYYSLLTLFINTFNELIAEYKDSKMAAKKKLKRLANSYDLHYRDPLQSTSILNKASCEKLERKLVVEALEKEKITGVKSPELACMSEEHITRLVNSKSPKTPKPRTMIEASDAFGTSPQTNNRRISPEDNKQKSSEKQPVHMTPKTVPYFRPFGSLSKSPSDPTIRLGSASRSAVRQLDLSSLSRSEPVCVPIQEASHSPRLTKEQQLMSQFAHRRLYNTGNSCYFNATMQSLSACIPLLMRCQRLSRFYHKDRERFSSLGQAKSSVLHGFLKLITILGVRPCDLGTPFGSNVAPFSTDSLKSIRLSIGKVNKDFDNDDQQDAHEYLVTILGLIDDLMESIAKRENVNITGQPVYGMSICSLNPAAVFQMKVETVYDCQACGARNFITETRSDLCLMIHEVCSVENLLPEYVKWSALEKHCEHCKHTVASTSDRIVEFPPCLIINLKRYERVGRDSYQKKVCTVKPSFQLDATFLGVTKILDTPPELEKTLPVEGTKTIADALASSGVFSALDNNNNSTPVKVKGGTTDEAMKDEEDLIVDFAKKSMFEFKCLSDAKEIKDILNIMNIKIGERQLEKHAARMEEITTTQFNKEDKPSKWKDIEADGNCFYRAISWSLTGNQGYYEKVRATVAEFIGNNRSMFEPYTNDFEAHLEEVGKDGTWARDTDIFALSTCLNVEIYTYLTEGWTLFTPRTQSNSPLPKRNGAIYLRNQRMHYEPVTSLKKFTSGENVNRRNLKRSRGEDEETTDDEEHDDDGKPKKKIETPMRRAQLARSCKTPTGGKHKTVAVSAYPESPGDVKYSLVSVVCHNGDSPEKGHYVAYTKDLYCDAWTYCSDSIINNVTKEEVETKAAESGYVLFYTRE